MSEDAEFNFITKCSAVVVDVAGTTTSMEYVKGTLFPFADKNCEEYLKANFENEDVKKAVKLLKDDIADIDAAISTFKQLSADNSDNEGLKIIQGLIYKEGYDSDKLKAHVFSDVPTTFETWAKTMKVAIYSTGSIDSQKLLFAHTTEGDVTAHIACYFDQANIGSKTDKASYEKIAKELDLKPEQVVFVSDDVKELKAAKEAKFYTVLVKREGNDDILESDSKEHFVVNGFSDLIGTGKRKCPMDDTTEIKEPPTKVAKTNQENSASKEPVATEKTNDDEKMEVDSTTESKKDEEVVAPSEGEKTTKAPEEATKTEEGEMDTNEEVVKDTDKVEAPPKKEVKDKEAEISSTNEEIEKSDVPVRKETETPAIVEESAKESVADSTDAVVAPVSTVEKTNDEPKMTTEEVVVDTNEEKEKTVDAKGESEKTDNKVVKDEEVEKAKEEEKKEEKKEAEEIKTVEEVVPSSNGNAQTEKTEEIVKEKVAIEEAETSANEVTDADTANGDAVKVDEKENKSELANGKAENGKAENGDTVEEEVKKTEEEKNSSEDIKVKKIEDAESTAPVSVEV